MNLIGNLTAGIIFLFSFMYDEEPTTAHQDNPTNSSLANDTTNEEDTISPTMNYSLVDSTQDQEYIDIDHRPHIDSNPNTDMNNSSTTAPQNQTVVSKPNIVIILADDMGTGDVPAYWGQGGVPM